MAFPGKQHTYNDNDILDSSDWDDEINVLAQVFGYEENPNNYTILINGFSDIEPVLKVFNDEDSNKILNIPDLSALLDTYIIEGQLVSGADNIAPFVVNSRELCRNLNAGFLNGRAHTDFEKNLFIFDCHTILYEGSIANSNPDRNHWICGEGGGFITKLKAKQELAGASADASTVVDFLKNGVSIGTITLANNPTTVYTNNIADVTLEENDVLSFRINSYVGSIRHENITAAFHIKKKFKV